MKKNNLFKVLCVAIFILASVILLAVSLPESIEEPEEISYNEFMELVNEGKVDTVMYSTSNEYMRVYLLNADTIGMTRKERDEYEYDGVEYIRTCLYPANDDFRKELMQAGVNVRLMTNGWTIGRVFEAISYLLPLVFLFYFMFAMSRQLNMQFNKKNLSAESSVRFDNVIGQDEILEDIKFIVRLIKEPNLGENLGVKTPKGVLLIGPPGTGKTLIAKAIAGEAGVPFLQIAGSDFKELYVGMGAKRVRELFEEARKKSPCVVFVDEIDAVGAKRQSAGSNSEDTQTVNALLKEMDGFKSREGIFVIAATNNVESLDPALIRAGRFDRQIEVNPPRDWNVRADLFKYYLKDAKLSDDVDIEGLSRQVVGFTGADIETVCNEAGIVALMAEKDVIDRASIEEAIDKKIFHGNRAKENKKNDIDSKVVVYHEAGHAIMSYLCGEGIARASIQATTSGVGGAVFGEDDNRKLKTKSYIENRVRICYAGRISEQIKFNEETTGASNDIHKATELLRDYVGVYGFSDDIGCLRLDAMHDAKLVTTEVGKVAKALYADAEDKLRTNYYLVEALAQKLLEVETLSGKEIYELIEKIKR